MGTSNHFLNALRADVVLLGKLPMSRSATGVFGSDCSDIIGRERSLRKSLATGNALGVSTGSVPVTGSGTFRHPAGPVLVSALDRFGALAGSVVVATGRVESSLRSGIEGIVLDGPATFYSWF